MKYTARLNSRIGKKTKWTWYTILRDGSYYGYIRISPDATEFQAENGVVEYRQLNGSLTLIIQQEYENLVINTGDYLKTVDDILEYLHWNL